MRHGSNLGNSATDSLKQPEGELKETLDRLEVDKIISKVNKPTG